jgi:CheY-like chemotaxis protein/HPt (histidine-containing phosphotransfer) domain-containing protein
VLLTSSAQRGEAARAESAGMAAYLAKPAHPVQLHACLATVLGAAGALATPIVTRHQLVVPASRGGRVLVAEDNVVNQHVATGMLISLGYEVHVVDDGQQAVAAAATGQFDLILMDCQMPVLDGYAATAILRAAEGAGHRTPIVAVTASAMKEDRQRCLDAGMDDHLAKPLRRDELAAVLARFHPQGGGAVVVAPREVSADAGTEESITARLDELFEGLGDDTGSDRCDLLESFLRRAAAEIDQIDTAITVRDNDALRSRAHSMKGMAANVGATGVAASAAIIEDAARDGDLSNLATTTADLRGALANANEVIRGMIGVTASTA